MELVEIVEVFQKMVADTELFVRTREYAGMTAVIGVAVASLDTWLGEGSITTTEYDEMLTTMKNRLFAAIASE